MTSGIHYDLGRIYYKTYYKPVSKNIKIIDNKIKQNKAQYDLDRQIAKIFALSSGNVSKCKLLTGKDILLGIELFEKATSTKRFEYSLLCSELWKQSSVAEKQYQKLDKVFEPNKKEEGKIKKSCARSNLVYNKDFKMYMYKYHNTKESAAKCFFGSKQNYLREFKHILKIFYHDTKEIKSNSED